MLLGPLRSRHHDRASQPEGAVLALGHRGTDGEGRDVEVVCDHEIIQRGLTPTTLSHRHVGGIAVGGISEANTNVNDEVAEAITCLVTRPVDVRIEVPSEEHGLIRASERPQALGNGRRELG
jgi:hypothetical protein